MIAFLSGFGPIGRAGQNNLSIHHGALMVQATGPFWRNHIYIDTMLPKTLQHRTIGRCIHVGAGQHTYLDASFSGELA